MLNRICWLLLVTCLVIGTSWAADNPFVGKWKVHPSESKLTDEMKVERRRWKQIRIQLWFRCILKRSWPTGLINPPFCDHISGYD